MAQVRTILGTQVLIAIGDGESPETFAHPCTINLDRSIEFTAGGNKIEVPDCDDPDAPAWTEFVKQTLECTLSGTGKLDAVDTTMAAYSEWLADPLPKHVKIFLMGRPTPSSVIGFFYGDFHLTKFGITGTRGEKATVSVGLDSDGPVLWHTGA